MKTTKKRYGLTLCLLIPGIIWIYIQVKVPNTKKSQSLSFLTDSYNRALTKVYRAGTPAQKQERIVNNTIHQRDIQDINQRPGQWRTILPTVKEEDVTRQPTAVTGTTTEDPVLSTQHIVVIVSYMRSGSTLTADILQHSPGTLYVFEPLHSVSVRTRQKKPLHYLNGTIRYLKEEDLTDEFLIDELHKWFTCNYEELDVHSLSDNFHDHFSRSMKTLTQCLKPKRKTVKSVRECLPKAIEMCKKATHLLFKFIRLPMGVIEDVFDLYSNLQVVHLLRDPRGLLTSQIKLDKSTWSKINDTSLSHCERVWSDLNSTIYLNSFFPDRVRILSYESLAENPLSVAERMYRYIDLPFRGPIRKYISKLTLEGKKDSTSYGIIRSNSTKTAYSWRNSINFTDVQIIDNNCKNAYQFLGYKSMPSDRTLKDHKIPTYVSPKKSIII